MQWKNIPCHPTHQLITNFHYPPPSPPPPPTHTHTYTHTHTHTHTHLTPPPFAYTYCTRPRKHPYQQNSTLKNRNCLQRGIWDNGTTHTNILHITNTKAIVHCVTPVFFVSIHSFIVLHPSFLFVFICILCYTRLYCLY